MLGSSESGTKCRALLAHSEHRRGTPARSTWLSDTDSTLEGDEMGETLALPVLPLDDVVVLPGMVVPIRISGADANAEARAAVDAATTAANHQVLLVPRLDGKYAAVGTLAEIEQVGRLPG